MSIRILMRMITEPDDEFQGHADLVLTREKILYLLKVKAVYEVTAKTLPDLVIMFLSDDDGTDIHWRFNDDLVDYLNLNREEEDLLDHQGWVEAPEYYVPPAGPDAEYGDELLTYDLQLEVREEGVYWKATANSYEVFTESALTWDELNTLLAKMGESP